MKKLKICAAAVLAVMLLNIPLIFAENETIVVDGETTTTQMEYKNYKLVFLVRETGKLTVNQNVVFSSNSRTSATSANPGVLANAGKLIIKDNVIFSSNTGVWGGCIYNNGKGTTNIGNNIKFSANEGGWGGCMYNAGTMSLGNNINFTSNTAEDGGGAIRNNKTMIIGTDAKFIGNVAISGNSRGGAIYSSSNHSTTIGDRAIFSQNSALYGGAICNSDGLLKIGNNVKFISNKADSVGGAIQNTEKETGKIFIGKNAEFTENSAGDSGGAICNSLGSINIADNALFDSNETRYNGGAIHNGLNNMVTIENGAKFINNKAGTGGGAIYNNAGIINLIAKTNDVEFMGNTANEVSSAIYDYCGTINLWAGNKSIIFNDKVESNDGSSILNINKSSGTLPTTGKIILNEDMTGYIGTVNFYNGTIELDENGTLFGGNMVIENSPAIDMANGLMKEYNLKNITINKSSDKLNLKVDADLENKKMTTITADSFSGEGKIKVKAINFISDIEIDETTEPILFTESEVLKDKVESVNTASSALYTYNVEYDPETGCFTFANTGENKTINLGTVASAVAASVGGYATQSVVVNQVFAGMDGKTFNKNQKSANINSSNLYVSAGDQVFEDSGKIEKGLWLRPFVLNETVKIGDTDVDNNLYGTLAGIDFPLGQDKQLSFYLGYAGSKQEVEEIKSKQTGYIVGATGMIIKDSWYAGLTANVIFNKASVDTDFGTDDIDMNMFTIGAKAGYNYNINEKWILEPNVTIMYGMVNSQSYETSQGAKIDSQSINNILLEPQVKAKLGLSNGWQPYALVGYAANLSSKPTVKAEGEELELDSIDGFIEYGVGVNKDFVGTVWSCYAQVTGRSGGRNGFAGNLGVKYKF